MRRIEAIVRPDALRAVLASLKDVSYPGVTVMEAQGHGAQKGVTPVYRSQSVEGLLPKLVVIMIVEDKVVDKVIDSIVKAVRKDEIGDGKIFVYDVIDAVRIRTGQRGVKAIHSTE
jgi:nitrogen regulatory protein P-II 1